MSQGPPPPDMSGDSRQPLSLIVRGPDRRDRAPLAGRRYREARRSGSLSLRLFQYFVPEMSTWAMRPLFVS